MSSTRARPRMPTVRAFVPRALRFQRGRVKPLTLERFASVLRVHLLPQHGAKPLDTIGKRVFAELTTKWLQGGATPRTVNTRLCVVARLLTIAVEIEVLVGAPKPRYLRAPKRYPRFLSEEEAARLLRAAEPKWRAMILVGMRTGLRIGELRGLQWWDADLLRGVVTVRRSDPGRADMPATTPKGGADRVVALSPEALAVLRDLRARVPDAPLTAHVWPGRGGRARHLRTCWWGMMSAVLKAGLAHRDRERRVTWHVLRHTCASWLVMRGVSLRIVQAILGHASIRQTEIYAHLAPDFVPFAAMASLDVPLIPWAQPIKALAAPSDHAEPVALALAR